MESAPRRKLATSATLDNMIELVSFLCIIKCEITYINFGRPRWMRCLTVGFSTLGTCNYATRFTLFFYFLFYAYPTFTSVDFQVFHIVGIKKCTFPCSLAGSLFLFDRKVLRCFHKDGHNQRKKKDGKTVKALHCYYVRGQDDVKFQRRIYWMLDT